jgi:hypothetical protein
LTVGPFHPYDCNMSKSEEIAHFFAPNNNLSGVDFCLPRFAGSQSVPLHLADASGDRFGYPSLAVAERDARSAMHVISLLGCAPAISGKVQFRSPEDFTDANEANRVRVLFGSRSNHALDAMMKEAHLSELVRFQFGHEWVIIGQDGRRFSLVDPSTLNREQYQSSTDYGVVARVSDKNNRAVFLIAGLGGRATEGSGLFLRDSWQELQRQFEDNDFAVILEFRPPVDPARFEAVASYQR